jgi:hypothetical protein
MARARFYYRFGVLDLFVDNALIDRVLEGEVDGKPVAIRIPADASVFDPDASRLAPAIRRTHESGERTVRTVQVSVDSALPFGVHDPSVVSMSVDYRWTIALSDGFATNLELATRVVSGLVEWSRVELDQFGLALTYDQPALVDVQRVFDLDAAEFYPLGMQAPGWASFRPGGARPVTEVFLRGVLATGHQEIPPALALLADARHLSMRPPQDWLRAVLAAAIATEVRVKQALRSAATDDARPLVDLLLDNPRDASLAAANLFDKAMQAVCGRSLRIEDKGLFKEVESLFRVRNEVAHHARRPTAERGARAVQAAVGAFAWLDSLAVADTGAGSEAETAASVGLTAIERRGPRSRKPPSQPRASRR